ncbi:MAG: HEAT repeat domain-containing protein [Planctomycetes bacterium]|nr:HEAT repeat domain-containing protein [Planctomycetota bacterium]
MRTTTAALLIVFCCLVPLTHAQEGQSLFERARYFEEVEGNYPKAIELYGRVANGDGAVLPDDSTRAWLRLGLCESRLGRLEVARQAFERAAKGDGPAAERARQVLAGGVDEERRSRNLVTHLLDLFVGRSDGWQDAGQSLVVLGDIAVPQIIERLEHEENEFDAAVDMAVLLIEIGTDRVVDYVEKVFTGEDAYAKRLLVSGILGGEYGTAQVPATATRLATALLPGLPIVPAIRRGTYAAALLAALPVDVCVGLLDGYGVEVRDPVLRELNRRGEFGSEASLRRIAAVALRAVEEDQSEAGWTLIKSAPFHQRSRGTLVTALKGRLLERPHGLFTPNVNSWLDVNNVSHSQLEDVDLGIDIASSVRLTPSELLELAEHWREAITSESRLWTRLSMATLIREHVAVWGGEAEPTLCRLVDFGLEIRAIDQWLEAHCADGPRLALVLFPHLEDVEARRCAWNCVRGALDADLLQHVAAAIRAEVPHASELVGFLAEMNRPDCWAVLDQLGESSMSAADSIALRVDEPSLLPSELLRRWIVSPAISDDARERLLWLAGVRGVRLDDRIGRVLELGIARYLRLVERGEGHAPRSTRFQWVPWLLGYVPIESRALAPSFDHPSYTPHAYDEAEVVKLLEATYLCGPPAEKIWTDLEPFVSRERSQVPIDFALRIPSLLDHAPSATVRDLSVKLYLDSAIAADAKRRTVGEWLAAGNLELLRAAVRTALPGVLDPDLLRRLLDCGDSAIVEDTLRQVAQLGDERARDWIAPFLRSPETSTRIAAVRALTALGFGSALDTLLDLLARDPDESIRQSVAQSLAERPEPASEAALVESLRDPSLPVRQAAKAALDALAVYHEYLARSRDRSSDGPRREEALQKLIAKATGQGAIPNRVAAIRALIAFPEPELTSVLIDLLEDRNPSIQTAAQATLDELLAVLAR